MRRTSPGAAAGRNHHPGIFAARTFTAAVFQRVSARDPGGPADPTEALAHRVRAILIISLWHTGALNSAARGALLVAMPAKI